MGDLTALQKEVNQMLFSKVGMMNLDDVQKLIASILGRVVHEPNSDACTDLLGEVISELQTLIVAKRGHPNE